MDFIELVQKMKRPEQQGSLLVFDPGHTTGWAVFDSNTLNARGQIDTTDIENTVENVQHLIDHFNPLQVVIEDYRIYKWRAEHHIGSDLPTARNIGCIETLVIQYGLYNLIKQPAQVAKVFCTDTRLREWGYYQKAMKHANDAIRHGCYFLLFGAVRKKDKNRSKVG